MMKPPGFGEYPSKEITELKRESAKMYLGMVKAKEGRIGLNIKQQI